MPSAPSSISSSDRDRPWHGLWTACLLLGTMEVAGWKAGVAPLPPAASIDDFSRSRPPDVLLVGDSRMGRVDFDAFAGAWAPGRALKGMVWIQDDGSAAALLESLLRRGLRPGLLVVAVSPLNALAPDRLRRGRERLRELEGFETWTVRLRSRLAAGLFVFPEQNGLALLFQEGLEWCQLLQGGGTFREEMDRRQERWERHYRGTYLADIRRFFSAQASPDREAMRALADAVRAAGRQGSRVVLVRLPVSRDTLELEEAWGAGPAFLRIAGDTGVPYVDFHGLPCYPALSEAVLDGCHVHGEGPRRMLATELGERVRLLAAP